MSAITFPVSELVLASPFDFGRRPRGDDDDDDDDDEPDPIAHANEAALSTSTGYCGSCSACGRRRDTPVEQCPDPE